MIPIYSKMPTSSGDLIESSRCSVFIPSASQIPGCFPHLSGLNRISVSKVPNSSHTSPLGLELCILEKEELFTRIFVLFLFLLKRKKIIKRWGVGENVLSLLGA